MLYLKSKVNPVMFLKALGPFQQYSFHPSFASVLYSLALAALALHWGHLEASIKVVVCIRCFLHGFSTLFALQGAVLGTAS